MLGIKGVDNECVGNRKNGGALRRASEWRVTFECY